MGFERVNRMIFENWVCDGLRDSVAQTTNRHPGPIPGSNAPRTLTLEEGWMPDKPGMTKKEAQAWHSTRKPSTH